MGKSRTLNLGTGSFVLLGFAALFFLTTQTTSHGLAVFGPPRYEVTAKFDNVGDLKVGAPVSMSGVEVGRVAKIDFDSNEYKAVVLLRLNARYNKIPVDSDASIYTQGLLGGKFIGLTAGGADTYLQDKGQIDFTQSAFVLENLIGQVLANFTKSKADEQSSGGCGSESDGENEMIKIITALLMAVLAGGVQAADAPSAAPNANNLTPQELVENSAKRMLAELDANRAVYKNDPAKLDALVGNVLLPNFDTEYAARLVLGQSWRTATPEQRKRFVEAFYHSLLRNYGAALVDFTGDRFIVLPYKGDPNETTATVRTEVKRSSGDKVPVNFSLHKTPAGWKAWDVVIEGISYVKSFRTDFASEIQQKGLDDVITRLEKEGKVGPNGAAVSH